MLKTPDARLALFPFSAEVNAQGHLIIAGVDTCQLVQEYGTPLYIYDALTITSEVARLNTLLKEHYQGESKIAYASKAYLSPAFAKKLKPMRIGLDVVSLAELEVARDAGFDPAGIHLHGNNKTVAEIQAALVLGIQAIVIDSIDEFHLVARIAEKMQKVARCWLRLTPDLVIETHKSIQTGHIDSKFGLHVQNGEIDEALAFGVANPWINLTGIHMHLGSQLRDPDTYRKAIEVMYAVSQSNGFIPQEISPGGGWGVRYIEPDPVIDESDWVRTVSEAVSSQCLQRGWPLPTLVLEPGRWLAAQAGVALYTAGSQKVTPGGQHIVAVDGGLADNPRVEMYGAQYTAKIANDMRSPNTESVQLVGRYCESGDILAEQISLPPLHRGDILAVPVSGAYHLSMSSNYNLVPRPAVLWLENGQAEVLHQREDLAKNPWWNPNPLGD